MSRSLFIDELEVPLGDQDLGITFQLNNLAELNDRQSNYSTTLKLEKTPELIRSIGDYDEIGAVNPKPYQLLPSRYQQNGKDIVPDGILELKNSGRQVSAVLRSGNFEFFSKIKGLNIEDLDLSEYDHERSVFGISQLINKSSGLVYPIIQYGALEIPTTLDLRYQHHSIYVHSLVDKIVQEQGFTKSGTIWSDPFYMSLALAFSENTLEGEKYDATRLEVANATAMNLVKEVVTVLWDDETYNQGQYVPSTGRYTFDSENTGSFRFEGEFNGFAVGDPEVDMFIFSSVKGQVARVTQIVEEDLTKWSPVTASTDELTWETGEQVWCVLDADGLQAHVNMRAGSKFVFEPIREAQMNDDLVITKNAPDIGQTDLMKLVANFFGLFFQVQNKNLHAFSFDELLANKPNARDWSDKLDQSQPPLISTKIGSYGQDNFMKYSEDGVEGFGDGSFSIPDETLPNEKTVITFKASASETEQVSGSAIAKIPRYTLEDGEYVKSETAKQRLLSLQPITFNGGILLTDGVATQAYDDTAMLGMFEIPGGGQDLTMNKAIGNYYQGFINSIQQLKVVKAQFNLSETDVESFDFSLPVWIQKWGSYFYVNKIENFREGSLTTVQLVKL